MRSLKITHSSHFYVCFHSSVKTHVKDFEIKLMVSNGNNFVHCKNNMTYYTFKLDFCPSLLFTEKFGLHLIFIITNALYIYLNIEV